MMAQHWAGEVWCCCDSAVCPSPSRRACSESKNNWRRQQRPDEAGHHCRCLATSSAQVRPGRGRSRRWLEPMDLSAARRAARLKCGRPVRAGSKRAETPANPTQRRAAASSVSDSGGQPWRPGHEERHRASGTSLERPSDLSRRAKMARPARSSRGSSASSLVDSDVDAIRVSPSSGLTAAAKANELGTPWTEKGAGRIAKPTWRRVARTGRSCPSAQACAEWAHARVLRAQAWCSRRQRARGLRGSPQRPVA